MTAPAVTPGAPEAAAPGTAREAPEGFDPGAYWETRHRVYSADDLRSTGNKLFTPAANEQQITEKVALLVWLLRGLGFGFGASLLDAGCGQGFTTRRLGTAGFDCTGVDVSPTAIASARAAGGADYAVAALDRMVLGRRFDIVLCTDVLYHLVEDAVWERALAALAGHLAEEGVLVLIEAFPGVSSGTPHVRWRTADAYAAGLGRQGLAVAAAETFRESVTGEEKTLLLACRPARAAGVAAAAVAASTGVLREVFARRSAHQEAMAAALAAARAEAAAREAALAAVRIEAMASARTGEIRLAAARAETELRGAREREARRGAKRAEARAAALEARLEELRRSRSFRIGHWLVRTAGLPAALLRRRVSSAPTPVAPVPPVSLPAAPAAPASRAARIAAVAAREEVARAEVLLYADIDLNVIDGAAVWLSSVASMLARHRRVVLLARRDLAIGAVADNIESRDRVAIVEPRHLGHRRAHLDLTEAVETIRGLDAALPGLRAVFVRGTDAASRLLADGRFYGRHDVYLTDFYEMGSEGTPVPEERARQLAVIAAGARRILVQTDLIAEKIRAVTGMEVPTLALPPPVPDDLPAPVAAASRDGAEGPIRIGYAGKLAPEGRIRELLDWTEILRGEGLDIELTILGNKISGPRTAAGLEALRRELTARMGTLGVIREEALPRAEALARMAGMDFVWCWRPEEFERTTLEVSTKLVEGVSAGFACICFPGETNRRLLGEDYPCFATGLDDIRRLVRGGRVRPPAATVAAVRAGHSFATLAARLDAALREDDGRDGGAAPLLCLVGEGAGEFDAYASRLKGRGRAVARAEGSAGAAAELAAFGAAGVVLCAGGPAEAAQVARLLPKGTRLLVRPGPAAGAEEDEEERLWGRVPAGRVERFLLASAVGPGTAAARGRPEAATAVLPGFAAGAALPFRARGFDGPVRLGMAGILPWEAARPDRAVDLLAALQAAGAAAELHLRGPRPEEAGLPAEALARCKALYDRLLADPALAAVTAFHPEEEAEDAFWAGVDHVLSPGKAGGLDPGLVRGVLSGCHPVVWSRPDVPDLLDPAWIVDSPEAAAARILGFRRQPAAARGSELARGRSLLLDRHGERAFRALDALLFPEG